MTNSRAKGARGEREFSRLCRDQGYSEVRRGQQFSGLEGEDVVGLPGIHVEVKRVQALNIANAMDQSQRDSREDQLSIVAHRKNNCPWMITMPADEWFEIYREWEAGKYLNKLKEDYAKMELV